MQQAIAENLQRLGDLRQEITAAWAELNDSLALQALWPEAFEHGQIKTALSNYDLSKPSRCRFLIKRSNGEIREFPLWAISDSLLAPHVKQVFTKADHNLGRFRQWLERKRKEQTA